MNLSYRIGWTCFRVMFATYFRWRVFNAERVPLQGGVVLDMAAPLRWALLEGIILRTRPKKSAHAYEQATTWHRQGPDNHLPRRVLDGRRALVGRAGGAGSCVG